jgi:hypothetical protein
MKILDIVGGAENVYDAERLKLIVYEALSY